MPPRLWRLPLPVAVVVAVIPAEIEAIGIAGVTVGTAVVASIARREAPAVMARVGMRALKVLETAIVTAIATAIAIVLMAMGVEASRAVPMVARAGATGIGIAHAVHAMGTETEIAKAVVNARLAVHVKVDRARVAHVMQGAVSRVRRVSRILLSPQRMCPQSP